jgi:dipeptide/tripeptide permease
MTRLGGPIAISLLMLFALDAAITPLSRTAGFVLSGLESLAAASVFLLTRRQFQARGYRAADLPLIACAALAIAIWLIILVGSISFFAFRVGMLGSQSTWPVALQIALIGLLISLCWFGDKCHEFAKTQGGIWKAVAITYQIASVALIVYVLTLLLLLTFLSGVAIVLGSIGALTLLAAWIVHAIALMLPSPVAQSQASS